MTNKPQAKIQYIDEDFPIDEIKHRLWKRAKSVKTKHLWSGTKAPKARRFKTKLLWSDKGLYVRFVANQNEPLIIEENPNLQNKTHGLWERDVCEIFLAPNRDNFRRYFEFEVAPNGEWLDVGIQQIKEKREADFAYNSGMKTATLVKKNKIIMALKIEWEAFGKSPKVNEIWLGNILRCVGKNEKRGYLSWSPTLTQTPNFHVPEQFGEFEFIR